MRNRNFTLEKALTKHVDCHDRLSGLEEYGYTGLDNGLKVSYLTDGIVAPHLQVCTTQILASPDLRQDFDGCANLYRDYERVAGDKATTRNVSGVESGEVQIEDRFYTDDEYSKLSDAQKRELRRIRDEKRSGGGNGGGRGNGGNGKSTAAKDKMLARLQKKVGNQKRELKALKQARAQEQEDSGDDDETSEAEEEASNAGGSNRNNSALSRGRRRNGRRGGGGRR